MPNALVCLVFALAVAGPGAGQESAAGSRERLIAALERLMMTGEPNQTSVDDGQLLQLAVDAAIRSGELASAAARFSKCRDRFPSKRSFTCPLMATSTWKQER